MLDHEYALQDEIKKVCSVDLRQQLKTWGFTRTTFKNVDSIFTSKLYGYKDVDDYYYRASCFHNIPNIKTPTLFMNALDDPVVGEACIDYDLFKNNENIAMATTKYGGHLGYGESHFSQKCWIVNPILKFLNGINGSIKDQN